MKTRNGFVSNSSSSSFVVSVPQGRNKAVTKIKIEIEVDLEQYADAVITDQEELDEWLHDEYCYDSVDEARDAGETWIADVYEKIQAELKKGRTVLAGRFSDNGTEPEEVFLCQYGIKPPKGSPIKVIENEAGY